MSRELYSLIGKASTVVLPRAPVRAKFNVKRRVTPWYAKSNDLPKSCISDDSYRVLQTCQNEARSDDLSIERWAKSTAIGDAGTVLSLNSEKRALIWELWVDTKANSAALSKIRREYWSYRIHWWRIRQALTKYVFDPAMRCGPSMTDQEYMQQILMMTGQRRRRTIYYIFADYTESVFQWYRIDTIFGGNPDQWR